MTLGHHVEVSPNAQTGWFILNQKKVLKISKRGFTRPTFATRNQVKWSITDITHFELFNDDLYSTKLTATC